MSFHEKISRTFDRIAVITVVIVSILSSHELAAAPIPLMASTKPELGVFRSPLGFQVSASDSGWAHSAPPKDNHLITTMYRAPKGNGLLTVRIDRLAKNIELEKYVQRWAKEYPRYGFDLLGSRPFTQNNDRGFVLDLVNRESQQQLRQVVFMKERSAVILTCRDLQASFKESLKSCNSIIRSFSWQ